MQPIRRRLIYSGLLAGLPFVAAARPARARVVIVGAGWGGLAAALALQRRPEWFEVVLIDRHQEFVDLTRMHRQLSATGGRPKIAAAFADLGLSVQQAEVLSIDRAGRQIETSTGALTYDWLIVATGIEEDWLALAQGDAVLAQRLQARCGAAYVAGAKTATELQGLLNCSGGRLLMNVPPAPYRCPPAPYERAVLLASRLQRRGVDFHLTLVDPNAPWSAYQRVFQDQFAGRITYLPNTSLRSIDLQTNTAALDVDEVAFDTAWLMPPQRAAGLCRVAGLMGLDVNGQPNAWAAVDPDSLQSRLDSRIYLVGDAVGVVSPLFGHFPKTAQMAVSMGRIAARSILAQHSGMLAPASLPSSTCRAVLSEDPPESVEILASYRRRGDGVLMQQFRQLRHQEAWQEAEDGLRQLLAEKTS